MPQGPKLFPARNLHSGRIWWNKRVSGRVCRGRPPSMNTRKQAVDRFHPSVAGHWVMK